MSDFHALQVLAKCHGTLARTVNQLWELGWPEDEDGLLWEARRSLALVNQAMEGPSLNLEESERLRVAVKDVLLSATSMSAVVEGNALLSRLSADKSPPTT